MPPWCLLASRRGSRAALARSGADHASSEILLTARGLSRRNDPEKKGAAHGQGHFGSRFIAYLIDEVALVALACVILIPFSILAGLPARSATR